MNTRSKVQGNFEGILGNLREIPHIECKIRGVERVKLHIILK